MDTSHYNFFKGSMVFVIWSWTWIDEDLSDVDGESDTSICGSDVNSLESSLESDEPPVDEKIPAITHSVIFKCIGSHKESQYKDKLAVAKRKRNKGTEVPVRLRPELDNQVDSNGKAFVCKVVPDQWERIGYVVREVCGIANLIA